MVINLTVADMLVGRFSMTGLLLFLGTGCDGETNARSTSVIYLISVYIFYRFPMTSLTSITVISLDRLHATFLLFRHRVIQNLVYWVTAACVWVLGAMISTLLVTWRVNLLRKKCDPFFVFMAIILLFLSICYLCFIRLHCR